MPEPHLVKRFEHNTAVFFYQIKHNIRTGIHKRGIRARRNLFLERHGKRKEHTKQQNNSNSNSDICHTYSNNIKDMTAVYIVYSTRTTIPPAHRKITPRREYWLNN